jgi:hypothetical protein
VHRLSLVSDVSCKERLEEALGNLRERIAELEVLRPRQAELEAEIAALEVQIAGPAERPLARVVPSRRRRLRWLAMAGAVLCAGAIWNAFSNSAHDTSAYSSHCNVRLDAEPTTTTPRSQAVYE